MQQNIRNCRCGGTASKPKSIKNCEDRWQIQCLVKRCNARNVGQGLQSTIDGWNRLSLHLYR